MSPLPQMPAGQTPLPAVPAGFNQQSPLAGLAMLPKLYEAMVAGQDERTKRDQAAAAADLQRQNIESEIANRQSEIAGRTATQDLERQKFARENSWHLDTVANELNTHLGPLRVEYDKRIAEAATEEDAQVLANSFNILYPHPDGIDAGKLLTKPYTPEEIRTIWASGKAARDKATGEAGYAQAHAAVEQAAVADIPLNEQLKRAQLAHTQAQAALTAAQTAEANARTHGLIPAQVAELGARTAEARQAAAKAALEMKRIQRQMELGGAGGASSERIVALPGGGNGLLQERPGKNGPEYFLKMPGDADPHKISQSQAMALLGHGTTAGTASADETEIRQAISGLDVTGTDLSEMDANKPFYSAYNKYVAGVVKAQGPKAEGPARARVAGWLLENGITSLPPGTTQYVVNGKPATVRGMPAFKIQGHVFLADGTEVDQNGNPVNR